MLWITNSPHKMVSKIIDPQRQLYRQPGWKLHAYCPLIGWRMARLWHHRPSMGTTIIGILYKIFAKKSMKNSPSSSILMMGWLVIFIIPAIVTKTGQPFGDSCTCWRVVIHGWEVSFLDAKKNHTST